MDRQPIISTLTVQKQIDTALGYPNKLPLECIKSTEYETEDLVTSQATMQWKLDIKVREKIKHLEEHHGQLQYMM